MLWAANEERLPAACAAAEVKGGRGEGGGGGKGAKANGEAEATSSSMNCNDGGGGEALASEEGSSPATAAATCATDHTACRLHEALRYILVSSRLKMLRALREGFQGVDNLSGTESAILGPGHEHSVYDFSKDLSCLTPAQIAMVLRGRPLTGGEELIRLFRWGVTPDQVGAGSSLNALDASTTDQVRSWLEGLVTRMDDDALETFLLRNGQADGLGMAGRGTCGNQRCDVS